MMTTTHLATSWTMTTLTGRKHISRVIPVAPTEVEGGGEEERGELVPCSGLQLHFFFLVHPSLLLFSQFREYPRIANEKERNDYKRDFDRDHLEYKDLQAELDGINKNLADVDRELDDLQEGSPQYLVRACREIHQCCISAQRRGSKLFILPDVCESVTCYDYK